MLLYIHVPFCRRKCNYCSFYSEPLLSGRDIIESIGKPSPLPRVQERMQVWLNHLLLEMAHWSDQLGRPAVETIFWGGGTPSLVPPDLIRLVLERARRCFRVDGKAEISLEANPESITDQSARELILAGINRVSLGAQSMDDSSLELMGRVHTSMDVFRAFHALRGADCRNINLDLIWGLPGQSVYAWLNQLAEIIRLKPEHISCYGLSVEAGTPLEQLMENGVFALPNERDLANMYVRGAENLEEAGYLHYEISNFARMGFQCRHNVGYWEGEDYLGLGPAATSTIGGTRWTNPRSLDQWAAGIASGKMAGEAEKLALSDRVLELLMLRLRTTRGLRVKAYRELTGHDFLRDHRQLVHALHRNGLLRIRNGYVWLTRNGMLVSNSILERFFESTKEKLAAATVA